MKDYCVIPASKQKEYKSQNTKNFVEKERDVFQIR